MVGRCVAEKLEVIGGVLVVRGHEQRHYAVEEGLTSRVVGEQGVPREQEGKILSLIITSAREGNNHTC